jgi:peptide/nickel transport system permease protein
VLPSRCYAGQGVLPGSPIQQRFCGGSVVDRYGRFLHQIVDGSFGRSAFVRGRELRGTVLGSASVSVSVVSGALLFALLIGLGIALIAGRGRVAGGSSRAFMYVAFGLQPFWLGLGLAYLFGWRWHLTPITTYADFFNPPRGEPGGAVQWAYHLILPWVTLGLAFAAMYTQLFRALFERARRAVDKVPPSERSAVRRAMRRQNLVAVGKRIGRDFGVALGLSILVESLFSLPGLGRLWLQSYYNYDQPAQEAALVLTVILALGFDQLVNVVGALSMSEWRT